MQVLTTTPRHFPTGTMVQHPLSASGALEVEDLAAGSISLVSSASLATCTSINFIDPLVGAVIRSTSCAELTDP
jgi:hypothetical protein